MSIGLCQIYIGEKKVKSFIFYHYFKIGHIEWDKNKNFKGFIYMDFKNTDGQSRLPHLIFFFKKCPIGFFFQTVLKKKPLWLKVREKLFVCPEVLKERQS